MKKRSPHAPRWMRPSKAEQQMSSPSFLITAVVGSLGIGHPARGSVVPQALGPRPASWWLTSLRRSASIVWWTHIRVRDWSFFRDRAVHRRVV